MNEVTAPPAPGHNRPPETADPLLDRLSETTTALSAKTRLDQLLAAAERVPAELLDDARAGDATTLYTMLDKARKAFDEQRTEEVKLFLESQRKVNAHFRTFVDGAATAMAGVKAKIDAYRRKKEAAAAAERQRLADEARAKQAEADRQAAEAKTAADQAEAKRKAEEAAALAKQAEQTKPAVQGSYGAKASGRKVWLFEVTDYSKLPEIVMGADKVKKAIDDTIKGLVKAGARDLGEGVRIYPDTATTIRS